MFPLLFSSSGNVQLAPLSLERATKISLSVPAVTPRFSSDSQATIQWPAPSLATVGFASKPVSVFPLVLRSWGGSQVCPLSLERATKMSLSVPAASFRFSSDSQTATQLPAPSVARSTSPSFESPPSEAALVFSHSGPVHVAPASVDRAKKISKSDPAES